MSPAFNTGDFLSFATEDAAQEDLTPEISEALRGKGETILVVEDEKIVRRVVVRKLTHLGYRVLEAASSQDALALCATPHDPIELVISDLVMPGMDGRQLVDRLKGEFPKIAVIFMSGYSEEMIVDQGVIDPGVAFLEKTSLSHSLAAKVRTVLDQKRQDAPSHTPPPPASQV
jgi:two-component system, cell cycle sensor histidine kinase and response regulator CckA